MDQPSARLMEKAYAVEWRLEGEDVSHIHGGYWYDDTDPSDIGTAHRNYMREFFGDLGIAEGDRVLDVGAGNGAAAIWLAETHGCHVHAVDIVELHTNAARRAVAARGLGDRIEVTCADILDLDFPDGMFDHACSMECLHHVADRKGVFRKLAAWLKPGGTLALAEHCVAPDGPVLPRWAVRECIASDLATDLADYRAALESAGFSLSGTRDVTKAVLTSSLRWVATDPDQQFKRYQRDTLGPLVALLTPLVVRLATAAQKRGDWSLQFIRAQRTS